MYIDTLITRRVQSQNLKNRNDVVSQFKLFEKCEKNDAPDI